MNFVKSPNVPNDTKIIIIGEKYSHLLKNPLENRGILALEMPNNPDVDERLSGHADLSVLHVADNMLFLAPYLEGSGLAEKLRELGFEIYFSKRKHSKLYPDDAWLNVCVCGKQLIGNARTADSDIVHFLTKDRGLSFLNVKQGYTKCSVSVVNEKAIITSDLGIHKRAVEAGLDSLIIQAGNVSLEGFDYGFIGGASFRLSNSEFAFTGHLDMHSDKNRILAFLSLHNISPVYITNKPIFDIGSAIQIIEKDS